MNICRLLNILEFSKVFSFIIFYSNVNFFIYLAKRELFMQLYCFIQRKAMFIGLCPLNAVFSFIYISVCADTLKTKTVFFSETSTLTTKLQVLSVMFQMHKISIIKMPALHICYYIFLGY
jgi:hypothetical protein